MGIVKPLFITPKHSCGEDLEFIKKIYGEFFIEESHSFIQRFGIRYCPKCDVYCCLE